MNFFLQVFVLSFMMLVGAPWFNHSWYCAYSVLPSVTMAEVQVCGRWYVLGTGLFSRYQGSPWKLCHLSGL